MAGSDGSEMCSCQNEARLAPLAAEEAGRERGGRYQGHLAVTEAQKVAETTASAGVLTNTCLTQFYGTL